MALNDWIREKWKHYNWAGSRSAQYGESNVLSNLTPLDYSNPKEKSISTTVDVYVTGSYLTGKGKIFTIRKRYSIHIVYTDSTIMQAMQEVRRKAISQFALDNPEFSISDIFVPELKPFFKPGAEPVYMYRGGRLYRYITKYAEGQYRLETEKEIYKDRITKIIRKYGIRRRDALITKL